MFLLLRLAWRNLFRNPRRTVLSGLAIGLGLAALIFFDAMLTGMVNNMIVTGTATFPGQAQIHRRGFRKTLDVKQTILDAPQVLAGLSREPEVKAFAPRVMSFGMLSSAADVSSVLLCGVDPEREPAVSRLVTAKKRGEFLDPGRPNEIYLGEKLAGNLSVETGDRVVVTVAQAASGDLSQEMFRVGGIFAFGVREMDTSFAFVDLSKAQRLLQIDGAIHEIAIVFRRLDAASDEHWDFWKRYSTHGNEAVGWGKIFPEMKALLEMSRASLLVSALILFGIVSFGIMNTLFMSLYERMFEFGVIRAVGTRPYQVALIMLFEACSLAVISILLGVAMGYGLTAYFAWTGIDYRGLEFTGVTIRDLIYPVFKLNQYIEYPIWLFAFTALVGLYPAIYAARLAPAKAMKRSL